MSESDAIKNTQRPNTVDSIYRDLVSLGVKPGDTLLVHSSLSRIGWVCGGQQAVNQALLKAVGPDGTICMPAHSGEISDPANWVDPPVPADWIDEIYAAMPAFDKDMTATRGMGVIAECFRKYPGTKRSGHPQVSFCANGKYSGYITAEHALTPKFGLGTPLGKLYGLQAKILLLGVGYGNCTSFHLAECMAGRKPEDHTGTSMMVDGERKWVSFTDIDYDADIFPQIGAEYERSGGDVAIGKVGSAECRLFEMKPAVDFAKEWLEIDQISGSIAYCGLVCDLCHLSDKCGGCRSENNCCGSRMSEAGCHQYDCCKEKGYDGCWECDCSPCNCGMYSDSHDVRLRAFIHYIKTHGKHKLAKKLHGNMKKGIRYGHGKDYDGLGSVEAVLKKLGSD